MKTVRRGVCHGVLLRCPFTASAIGLLAPIQLVLADIVEQVLVKITVLLQILHKCNISLLLCKQCNFYAEVVAQYRTNLKIRWE